jgi:hypothetical protein
MSGLILQFCCVAMPRGRSGPSKLVACLDRMCPHRAVGWVKGTQAYLKAISPRLPSQSNSGGNEILARRLLDDSDDAAMQSTCLAGT